MSATSRTRTRGDCRVEVTDPATRCIVAITVTTMTIVKSNAAMHARANNFVMAFSRQGYSVRCAATRQPGNPATRKPGNAQRTHGKLILVSDPRVLDILRRYWGYESLRPLQ